MMLSQSPNCRAVASIDNFGSSTVLRFSERFSPNPPEFCRFPDTDAGNGGKAGGIGGVTDPNPHPLFNNLGGDGGGGGPGGGTNGSTTFDTTDTTAWHNWFGYNPGTTLTFCSGTVRDSTTSWDLGITGSWKSIAEAYELCEPYDPFSVPCFSALDSLALVPIFNKPWRNFSSASLKQRNRNNSIGSISTSTFRLCPTWTFGGLRHLNPAANPGHSHRTQARKLLERLHAAEFHSRRDSRHFPFVLEPQQHEALHLCETFDKLRNPSHWSPEARFHTQHQNPFQWGPVTHFQHQNPSYVSSVTHFQHQNPSCVSPVTRFGQHQSPSQVSSVTHPGLGYELLRRHVSWVLSYQTPS